MESQNSFLGKGWKFFPVFNQHSWSVEMVENEEDIRESLQILFSTMPGERLMEPAYGCDLSSLAFQRLDLNLETFMINNIKKTIADNEPRIKVNNIEIETSNMFDGIISLRVEYTIKATNDVRNMVYPYYFEKNIS